MTGSSPLARGLHHMMELLAVTTRIIPARAGFTRQPCCRWPGRPDHPRSRGVYVHVNRGYPWSDGSSPLARGLLLHQSREQGPDGIIPARAGFTPLSGKMTASFTDHPRSRGVYISLPHGDHIHVGSSPLARGLQRRGCLRQAQARIIPARAGFTVTIRELLCPRGDHPRSRGVYRDNAARPMEGMGSSPLARGLRPKRRPVRFLRRIIPARAGFTGCGHY